MLCGEKLTLFLGFHALGHHRQIKPAAKRDYGANDCGRLLALAEIGHESLVDLDFVERE